MTQETTEAIIDDHEQHEAYKFDHRTKTLTRTIKKTSDIKFGDRKAGSITETSVQSYDEEGIKVLVQELKLHRDNVAKSFASVNNTIEATKHIENDAEMEEFFKKFSQLQNYQKKKQAEMQREHLIKDLDMSKKQLKAVVDAIGSHLDLDA